MARRSFVLCLRRVCTVKKSVEESDYEITQVSDGKTSSVLNSPRKKKKERMRYTRMYPYLKYYVLYLPLLFGFFVTIALISPSPDAVAAVTQNSYI